MGIEASVEEQESTKNEIVSISSDQLYVGDKNNTGKKEDEEEKPVAAEPTSSEPSTEAAAITMAKQAAKNVVAGKKDGGELKKSANVELEQSSDLESS